MQRHCLWRYSQILPIWLFVVPFHSTNIHLVSTVFHLLVEFWGCNGEQNQAKSLPSWNLRAPVGKIGTLKQPTEKHRYLARCSVKKRAWCYKRIWQRYCPGGRVREIFPEQWATPQIWACIVRPLCAQNGLPCPHPLTYLLPHFDTSPSQLSSVSRTSFWPFP